MIDLDFGNLRVRYFHGYLETDSVSLIDTLLGEELLNNHKTFIWYI